MSTPSYPIGFTNGSINLTQGEERKVAEALYHLLNTELSERIWFPEYGYSPDLFSEKQDLTTDIQILKMVVREYMRNYDFTLRDISATVDQNGKLKFKVIYSTLDYGDTEVNT